MSDKQAGHLSDLLIDRVTSKTNDTNYVFNYWFHHVVFVVYFLCFFLQCITKPSIDLEAEEPTEEEEIDLNDATQGTLCYL